MEKNTQFCLGSTPPPPILKYKKFFLKLVNKFRKSNNSNKNQESIIKVEQVKEPRKQEDFNEIFGEGEVLAAWVEPRDYQILQKILNNNTVKIYA